MKTIIYSLISAFIVWIVTQVTSISIVLGILIFVVSISILVSINFFINWIQAQKENNNLKTTINQTKSENEQLLKEIKQLRDELDKLHQNQTALYNT
ncbi:bZIP transcription factor, partial [Leuconostoc suionicum]